MHVDAVAAATLGLALGFGATVFTGSAYAAAAGALAGAAVTFSILQRLAAPRPQALPQFALAELAESELLLTLDQRLAPEELLLEDRLTAADTDSRVVRLFDCARLTDPGELQQRIEQHLQAPSRAADRPRPPTDDSAALHAALDSLKRSLR